MKDFRLTLPALNGFEGIQKAFKALVALEGE